MKLGRLNTPTGPLPVLFEQDVTYDLSPITTDIDRGFHERGGIDLARAAMIAGDLRTVASGLGTSMAAPIARPGKVVCVGLNYRDHAEETGAAIPTEPVVFMKDPSTVVGPYDTILIPRRSRKTDWEVELGVVIGRTARYLDSPADALATVAGYAVSHDVSEREFQLERGGQWDKGKSCETFNPLGPYLVTRDEIPDPQQLGLRLSVNGRQRQNGSTADMIFSVEYVIWYLSQFMVLHPGDLINTGTPAGVALGQADDVYLRTGDVVELEIDGLGTSRQTVSAA
ncbi:2-hydroxyhepta-2,4-diene-1,7-dioate isomerase [Plantibacter flavus]|uniref:fumarylacetoacetate hydrolase family protein n=1 Tax=Plantibacter TaxID=190323 RepID=UPI0010C18801|nr:MULTISPECIES: fumarylacetoacetate hydrolase family protein [Plantibacter]MBD8103893.1 fumarylacetoacetate hydrolase family protein [Plantibacter sp. CFBP 8775]MBD8467341.1 fumarylacetoacetate hydrolase family protein [Plantibacter sp. CFBP 8798]TKJ96808.1 2-hydroxyhepta-2,4-diene-1,7-dioate isomerase [Plantibacter flavus]